MNPSTSRNDSTGGTRRRSRPTIPHGDPSRLWSRRLRHLELLRKHLVEIGLLAEAAALRNALEMDEGS